MRGTTSVRLRSAEPGTSGDLAAAAAGRGIRTAAMLVEPDRKRDTDSRTRPD